MDHVGSRLFFEQIAGELKTNIREKPREENGKAPQKSPVLHKPPHPRRSLATDLNSPRKWSDSARKSRRSLCIPFS